MVKLVLAATAFVLGGIAQAQEPAPPAEPPKVGSELEKMAPYSGWKTHTGKVEDCLAVFTVETGDDSPIIYTTGVAVRCDGFILVPVSVYDAVNRPKTRVKVTLSGAENETLPNALKVDGKPAHRSHRAEIHVVKVSNHHIKSARLLDPANLKIGTPVKIITAVPLREGVGRTVVEATVGQQGEKDAWGLTFPEDTTPPTLVPGAVVVDIQSGAVVGMVTKGGGAPYSFDSLAYFNDNCGEVGLCPDRDAVQFKTKAGSSMVRVAGGPIQVTDNDYIARYRTEVACTADFYCDTNLVSVQQYREWMDSKKGVPWPNSWNQKQAPLHPKDVSGWPVTGVRPEEIRWMAADKKKRMLTWIEWERAAYTTDISWLRTIDAPAEVAQEIENADRAFDTAVRQRVVARSIQKSIAQQVLNQNSGTGSRGAGGRGTSSFAAAIAAAKSTDVTDLSNSWAEQLDRAMVTLFPNRPGSNLTKLKGPGWPHDVGSQTKDKSEWGVMDMISNVPEVVIDRGGTYQVMSKIAGSRLDPFVSTVQWSVSAALGGGGVSREVIVGVAQSQTGMTHIANAPLRDPLFWRAVYEARDGKQVPLIVPDTKTIETEGMANQISSFSRFYLIKPAVLPGFRLAR